MRRRVWILAKIAKQLLVYSCDFILVLTSSRVVDRVSSKSSKHISWSVMAALIHVCKSLILVSVNTFSPPGPTSITTTETLSRLTPSSIWLRQSEKAAAAPWFEFDIMVFLKLESSAMETRRESLKMASGSVRFWDDNEVMLEKHESG